MITTGGSDEKIDKYIRSDGEVNTDHFLHILKNDLKKATEKIKVCYVINKYYDLIFLFYYLYSFHNIIIGRKEKERRG